MRKIAYVILALICVPFFRATLLDFVYVFLAINVIHDIFPKTGFYPYPIEGKK